MDSIAGRLRKSFQINVLGSLISPSIFSFQLSRSSFGFGDIIPGWSMFHLRIAFISCWFGGSPVVAGSGRVGSWVLVGVGDGEVSVGVTVGGVF